MKTLIGLVIILQIPLTWACDGIFPSNHLSIPLKGKNEGLSELRYNAVIDKVAKVYSSVAREHGALLKIDRLWENGTVNAGTWQDEGGKHWHMNLYGGLARHPLMTEDAYALVICHEIGHHIGGAPKKVINNRPFWSSTEGQADYWATLKCLRRVFQDDDNQAAIQGADIPQLVHKECSGNFSDKKYASLCIRTALAGKVLSSVSSLVRVTSLPDYETPDPTVVDQTYDKHPIPQCRLDTYFQGSICSKSFKGSVSQKDEVSGTCHPKIGYHTGLRPLCWFRPQ